MLKSDCDVDYIKIKAPATAANLGAGFEVFEMALGNPYDVIELKRLSHNYPTANRNYTIVQTSKKTLSF